MKTVHDLGQRMSSFVEGFQDALCRALEEEDGQARFREDRWERAGGGGGRTRVLEGGRVFEKGAVNVSTVWGQLEEAFAQKLPGAGRDFFATGVSLILHPESPLVPTVHANFRFIQQGPTAWFGGGSDLTPHYLFEEDAAHFHRVLKDACERHEPGSYLRFKEACDRYFWLAHRGEARGVGGIFFEHTGRDLEVDFAFVQDCASAFASAYLPIVQRRKGLPWTEAQRAWSELRRGRYVEFNLVHDRGTLFGLQTHGRTESILVSLPPRAAWVYDHHPAAGSEEARLLDVLRHPRPWA
ncbi:MAG TPA: oxygen-dependent coproporphyrinogen oxidase [Myxococcaceae bacterium]|nr:oxygen-dependent coproporphyrinogen oxidase [Myxococcaceae bacterium]